MVALELTEQIPAQIRHLARGVRGQGGLILVALGNSSAVLLGALTWLLLARLLTVADYGRVNYLASIAILASGVASLGMPATLQAYLPRGDEHISSGAALTALSLGLALGIPLAALHPTLPLITVGYALYTVATSERLGRRDYGGYALLQVLSRLGLLAWVLAAVPSLGADGALLGFALVNLASASWILRGVARPREGLASVRSHIRFSLAALAMAMTSSAALRLDKVLIGSLYGEETLGYYQLAFQFYAAIAVIPASLRSYLLPERSSGRGTRRAELIGIALSALAACLGALLSPLVIRSLFPDFYPESAAAARIASLAAVPGAAFSVWSAGKLSQERPTLVLAANLLSISTLAASIAVLGRLAGIPGLAASLLVYRSSAAAAAGALDRLESRGALLPRGQRGRGMSDRAASAAGGKLAEADAGRQKPSRRPGGPTRSPSAVQVWVAGGGPPPGTPHKGPTSVS